MVELKKQKRGSTFRLLDAQLVIHAFSHSSGAITRAAGPEWGIN